MVWHPTLRSMAGCVTGSNLDGASPLLLSDLLGSKPPSSNRMEEGWLPDSALRLDDNVMTSVSVNPSWLPSAPLKWPNASLVRPAERQMPFSRAVELISHPHRNHQAMDEPRSYLRFISLDSLQGLVGAVPLQTALRSIDASSLQAANLLLGDGRLRSSLHFDDRDNLLVQLRGSKSVVLVPPRLLPELNFTSREAAGSCTRGTGRPPWRRCVCWHQPTGRPPVENHRPSNRLKTARRRASPRAMTTRNPAGAATRRAANSQRERNDEADARAA